MSSLAEVPASGVRSTPGPLGLPLQRPGIIFSIAIAQLLTILPLVSEVSLWVGMVSIGAIGWRLLGDHFHWSMPGRWIRLVIGLAGAGLIYADFHTLVSRDAGLSLFVLMTSLRQLELSRYRDGMNALFLTLFLLVVNFLYSQSLAMALYALGALLWILMSLQGLQRVDGLSWRHNGLRRTVRALAYMLPLAVALFVFFPRLAQPLWQMPGRHTQGNGVDDVMTPGDISSLSLSDEIAFRVKFDGATPAKSQMYWRGLVLADFDGLTWRRGDHYQAVKLEPESALIDYQIALEPTQRNWLYSLDASVSVAGRAPVFDALETETVRQVSRLRSYRGRAALVYRLQPKLGEQWRKRYLQLPRSGNQRSREWARALRAKSSSASDFVNRVLKFIHQQNFYYTLSPPILGREGIDDFWFNTRRGFCEHYASNFTFLARAAGIPARVVVGYQGGEKNPYSDYWIVRQANAHAWSEIWLAGRGWVRIDATAAINPARVEASAVRAFAGRKPMFDSALFDTLIASNTGLYQRMGWMIDALNSRWKKWVVDYNQDNQRSLLKWAGFSSFSLRPLLWALVVVVMLTMATWYWLMLRQRPHQTEIVVLYQRALAQLEKKGLGRNPAEGPISHLQRIKRSTPDAVAKFERLIETYVTSQFGGINPGGRELSDLRRQLSIFHRGRHGMFT